MSGVPVDGCDDGPVIGARIGEFELVSELGRGGMGVVYLARQHEPVEREVALKLIQGRIRTAPARAMFRIEAQALARMEHPAIARVYSAGRTDQGHPWFAMERIVGSTLGEYVHRQQPAAEVLLRLFIQICLGVHHAHQKGVIHRDLKLGNIMITVIDGQAQPKIIDFGLALPVTGNRRHQADRSGTRDYMSPEQRSGQESIDIRTDVYALGVILLKLLAPQRFFELREAARRAQGLPLLLEAAVHPAAPGAAPEPQIDCLRSIPMELRWVLRKALSTGRDERYGSAHQLGEDLQRYLDRRPLGAVPDRRGYRLRKFVQRHRPAVLASTIALLFLCVGAVVATQNYLRAEAALKVSRVETAKASRIADFLSELLGGVAPEVARGMDTRLLKLLLDDAARRAETELATEPEVRASVDAAMARTYALISEYSAASALGERAMAALPDGPPGDFKLRLAANLATWRIDGGAAESGLTDLQAAVERLRQLRPAEHPDVLAARSALTWYRMWSGADVQSSYDELKELLPAMRQHLGPEDSLSLLAQHRLGILAIDTGRLDEARGLFEDLVAVRRNVAGDAHPDTLMALNSLAILHLQAHRYDTGAELLKALLPLAEKVFGPDHESTLSVVGNLGGALRQSGAVVESGTYYRRAWDGMRAKFGPNDRRTLMFQSNLGNYLWQTGALTEAAALQEPATTQLVNQLGDQHPMSAEVMFSYGRTLLSLGRRDAAISLLEQAAAIRGKLLPQDSAERIEVEQLLEQARAKR